MNPIEETLEKCQHELPALSVSCEVDGKRIGDPPARLMDVVQFMLTVQDEATTFVLKLKREQTPNGYPYFTGIAYGLAGARPNEPIFNIRWVNMAWVRADSALEVERLNSTNAILNLRHRDFYAKDIAAKQAKAAQEKVDAEEAKAAHERYLNSDQARFDDAKAILTNCKHEMASAQRVLDEGKQVARLSGIDDAYRRDRQIAAQTIVGCKQSIKEYWPIYRRYGGKAKSFSELGP